MDKGNTLERIKQCFQKILSNHDDARTNISPLHFIASLVFCFMGDSKKFSLESIRRKMISQLGISIRKSSFWERLSRDRLKIFLRLIVTELIKQLTCSALYGEDILSALEVSAIYLVDSSSITLWDGSKKNFPGSRTHAGIKLHLCFNLFSGLIKWFDLTPTSTNDRKCFPPLALLKGALTIYDLGHWDYGLLRAIELAEGFFLSRIKTNSAITILQVVKGISPLHVGKKLSSLRFKRRGKVIVELVGLIMIEGIGHPYRIVGFWNPQGKTYHWYITNLNAPSSTIYSLYRIRWQIELIFKSCKNSLNANQITSNEENIIENLLLAHMVAHLISHSIQNIGIDEMDKQKKMAFSYQRVAKIAVVLADDFVRFLTTTSVKYLNILLGKIILLSNDLFDPNYKHRPTSVQRLSKELLFSNNRIDLSKDSCKFFKFIKKNKNANKSSSSMNANKKVA